MRHCTYAIFIFLMHVPFWIYPDALQDHLDRAHESYMTGEAAQTIAEREQAFNRALKLYGRLEDEPGNGLLYYNVGNTYFQLEEYGWAVLYYLKGLQLLPRDDLLRFHLSLAQAEQGLPIEAANPIADKLFFWQRFLAQHERIYLDLILLALAFVLLSFWIWFPYEGFKIAGIVTTVATTVVFTSIIYAQYFAPLQAVVVKSFGLYHGPSEEAALVDDIPFIPGTVVNIRETTDDGSWLNIVSPEGKMGYLPADVLRML